MFFGSWEIFLALVCLVVVVAMLAVIVAVAIILSKEGQHRREIEQAAKAGRPEVGEAAGGEDQAD